MVAWGQRQLQPIFSDQGNGCNNCLCTANLTVLGILMKPLFPHTEYITTDESCEKD